MKRVVLILVLSLFTVLIYSQDSKLTPGRISMVFSIRGGGDQADLMLSLAEKIFVNNNFKVLDRSSIRDEPISEVADCHVIIDFKITGNSTLRHYGSSTKQYRARIIVKVITTNNNILIAGPTIGSLEYTQFNSDDNIEDALNDLVSQILPTLKTTIKEGKLVATDEAVRKKRKEERIFAIKQQREKEAHEIKKRRKIEALALKKQKEKESQEMKKMRQSNKKKRLVLAGVIDWSQYAHGDFLGEIFRGDFKRFRQNLGTMGNIRRDGNFKLLFATFVETFYRKCKSSLPTNAKRCRIYKREGSRMLNVDEISVAPGLAEQYRDYFNASNANVLINLLSSKNSLDSLKSITGIVTDMQHFFGDNLCRSRAIRQLEENLRRCSLNLPSLQEDPDGLLR
jgi:hypothetical protein